MLFLMKFQLIQLVLFRIHELQRSKTFLWMGFVLIKFVILEVYELR